jgi:tetratricopeptide (TPR) repeat protein
MTDSRHGVADDRSRPGLESAAPMAEALRLVEARRFEAAVETLNGVLAQLPGHEEALRHRAWLSQILSRHEAALADLERLALSRPDDPEVWRLRAGSLRALGRHDPAEAAFLEAIRLDPDYVPALADLGNLCRDTGRHDEAIAWLERARRSAPADRRLDTLLGAALLAAGRIDSAQTVLEAAFEANPYDRLTLAYLYVAYCRSGRRADALDLARPELFIRSEQRPGSRPSSGGDGDDLDARLAHHVRGYPGLQFERPGNTTRGGAQTGNLLAGSPGPVTELAAWLDQQVRACLSALPMDGSHPYLGWTPARWDLDIWGVVLRPGGFQESHIHPDGWLSGVYYAAVPPGIGESGPAGCLQIGTPPSTFGPPEAFPSRVLPPRPGYLCLFPSFLWHRTVPYDTPGERICLAFDVRPRV